MDPVGGDMSALLKERDRLKNTSTTNNSDFDRDGFLVIKNIIDTSFVDEKIPKTHGMFYQHRDGYWFNSGDEDMYPCRHSRYKHPMFEDVHYQVKSLLETKLGKKLYPTYWVDRYYFDGANLEAHMDRESCEVSVSIQLRSNLKRPWSFGIENGENMPVLLKLNDGDGVVYKGCERIHWRGKFPKEYDTNWMGREKKREGLYHHQLFLHYVLQDGQRSHHAWDRLR